MPSGDTATWLFSWLQQSALVVMAAGFLWLVKVTVNDNKHTLERIEELLKQLVQQRKGEV